jgi:integrase
LAVFKTIFNQAIKNDKAEKNPAQGATLLKDNNEWNRILSPEEYIRLLAHCPAHIKPVVKVPYHTGMRQGEILNFTWVQVDVKEGFIKLAPEHCKSNDGRLVPLTRELVEMFKAMTRGLPAVKVFTYAGRQIGASKK